MVLTQMLAFVAMAALGGAAYVLIKARRWANLRSFRSCRHILVALITGVLYYQLHSAYTFPNLVMAFVSGYAGPSFIQELTERLRGRP